MKCLQMGYITSNIFRQKDNLPYQLLLLPRHATAISSFLLLYLEFPWKYHFFISKITLLKSSFWRLHFWQRKPALFVQDKCIFLFHLLPSFLSFKTMLEVLLQPGILFSVADYPQHHWYNFKLCERSSSIQWKIGKKIKEGTEVKDN